MTKEERTGSMKPVAISGPLLIWMTTCINKLDQEFGSVHGRKHFLFKTEVTCELEGPILQPIMQCCPGRMQNRSLNLVTNMLINSIPYALITYSLAFILPSLE
ncbi:hypothetical protein VNO77_04082 [Canavalia gladiata]|uniref:Uncharacterized protein n=1 Tax=Canavalia gladiata TaxID=3824 RepID=A0AAN9R4I2_CANGL